MNNLKRERRLVLNNLTKSLYPNYLTDEAITSYYYFVLFSKQDLINTEYPELEITDIVELKRYKDGTWVMKNEFINKLKKYSPNPITLIGGYENYEIAANKLNTSIKGFGKGGVKLSFIKVNNDFNKNSESLSSIDKENSNDFWGKSVDVKNKNYPVKKAEPITKDSDSKKEDFWGKSIKIKD